MNIDIKFKINIKGCIIMENIIYSDEIRISDWVKSKDELLIGQSNCVGCKKDCNSCSFFYELCRDINSTYLSDETANLNVPLDNIVVAFARLGLWNGVKPGFKLLSTNLNSIFQVNCDINTYYYDRYNVKARCVHHDGTNHITFRKLKSGVNKDWFENYMYDNNFELSSSQLSRYTESLVPYVKSIYGL